MESITGILLAAVFLLVVILFFIYGSWQRRRGLEDLDTHSSLPILNRFSIFSGTLLMIWSLFILVILLCMFTYMIAKP
jgi:uncharacterized membrane protein YidH (DUF202 family)